VFQLRDYPEQQAINNSDSIIFNWSPLSPNDIAVVITVAEMNTDDPNPRDAGWTRLANIVTNNVQLGVFYARVSQIVEVISGQVQFYPIDTSANVNKISGLLMFFENDWTEIHPIFQDFLLAPSGDQQAPLPINAPVPTSEYVQLLSLIRWQSDYQPGLILVTQGSGTLGNADMLALGQGATFNVSFGLAYQTLSANTPTGITAIGSGRVAQQLHRGVMYLSASLSAPVAPEPLGPYRTHQSVTLAEPPLQNPRATTWNAEIGTGKDVLLERLIDAMKERFAGTASELALARIGSERGINRFSFEPLEVYRTRVINAFSFWEKAGTIPGIKQALNQAGWKASIVEAYKSQPSIEPWQETGALDVWQDAPTNSDIWNLETWANFDVYISALNPIYNVTDTWSDVAVSGDVWSDAPVPSDVWNYGFLAVPTDQIRDLIREVKSGHSRLVKLFFCDPQTEFWSDTPEIGDTWSDSIVLGDVWLDYDIVLI
jgi:hypothetical protein